jgi:(p)ppGpp synthase/HD superfamily hydrolase
MPTIEDARAFAIRAHGNQRYGEHPYVYHLDAVAALLAPYGEQAVIAGYLHDVVEDTDVTLDEVARHFGQEITDAVALVTDAPGANRRERKALTHAKLAQCDNPLALTVKAADRLANLQMSLATANQGKLEMYRKEHAAFKAAAYRAGLCEALWGEMDAIIGNA